jgi:hypothetical protein
MIGQTLPTIKSENSASPGVSTPATTVKVEEGVALPADIVEVKDSAPSSSGVPVSNGKTSPTNTEKE